MIFNFKLITILTPNLLKNKTKEYGNQGVESEKI